LFATGLSDTAWLVRHSDMKGFVMLYAILCYHKEDVVGAWSKQEEDACMARLATVQEGLAKEGRLGPVARLLPTTAAASVRMNGDEPLVIDGPFAETKEQLLGFYLIESENLEGAIEVARQLEKANPGGTHEVRPVGLYSPVAATI
jgi:hypothetical protein